MYETSGCATIDPVFDAGACGVSSCGFAEHAVIEAEPRGEPQSAPVEPAREAARSPAERRPEDGKVMIVDDEPINVKLAQKFLKLAGYSRFVTSSEPRNVVEEVIASRPDVLLLDVVMPEIDGL